MRERDPACPLVGFCSGHHSSADVIACPSRLPASTSSSSSKNAKETRMHDADLLCSAGSAQRAPGRKATVRAHEARSNAPFPCQALLHQHIGASFMPTSPPGDSRR